MYYIANEKSLQFNTIKEKYGRFVIPYDGKGIPAELTAILHRVKYWLDSFQSINILGIQDLVFRSDIVTVYTQHGINFFKPGFWGDGAIGNTVFKKIVFSNESERELFKKYYTYNDEDTILAGLSRWDLMRDKTDRIVLFYFTGRDYIRMLANLEKSDYVRAILGVLRSKELECVARNHGVKFYVAIHHTIRKYLDLKSEVITFIEDKDISSVKNIAAMLVTDFSSMCFDFLYKNRPVVFYRVDAHSDDLKLSADSFINNENVEKHNDELFNIFYGFDAVIEEIKKIYKKWFCIGVEQGLDCEKVF